MGHHVQLIVGPRPLLERIPARCPGAVVADLRGIACVPIERGLADAIARAVPTASAPQLEGEEAHVHLAAVYGLLVELSHEAAIGYLETEYFGGRGTQMAVLLRDGQLVLCEQSEGGPINRVLAALGVRRECHRDEFEAAGLVEHRFHDKLLGRR